MLGFLGVQQAKPTPGSPPRTPPPPSTRVYIEDRKRFPETLTSDERRTLEEFKRRLRAEGITGDGWESEHDLCRWLRARGFDLGKTMAMVKDDVAWRREYKVDDVYADFTHRSPREVKAAYPQTYHKTDRVGRPVNIDLVGRLNLKQLLEVTTPDEMERAKIWEMEHTLRVKYPACTQRAGRVINQSFVIMDMDGFSLRKWNGQTQAMLSRLIKVLSDHYPETMGVLFIINAPGVFTAVWRVVKSLLDPGTAKKITILGRDYHEQLFEHIDPNDLPAFLGGNDTTFDPLLEQGPWASKSTVSAQQRRGSYVPMVVPRPSTRGLGCFGCIGGRQRQDPAAI